MATNLDVRVGGKWLSLTCLYGDIEMSTVWPGGSDELSWSVGSQSGFRSRGGELVDACFGGVPVWAGSLLEPDPSQDRLVAQGAWRDAEGFVALDSLGAATKTPDTAIDQAIARGLRWTRPATLSSSNTVSDITQGPLSLDVLLDNFAENQGISWAVDPTRQVFSKTDDVTPSYKTLPVAGGLGYALDNYASTVVARYLDGATSTFKTVTVTDAVAEAAHGHVEAVVDLTGRGSTSTATATNIATNMLNTRRSTPQWTTPLEVSYGEILTAGGAPVVLETVAAGAVLRVNGGFELAMRQNGAMYVDMLIGQTQLSDGTLTIQPLLKATRSYQDFVTAALSK